MDSQTQTNQENSTMKTEYLHSTVPSQEETKTNSSTKGNNFLVTFLSTLLLLATVAAAFFAWQTQNLVKQINKLKVDSSQNYSTTNNSTPTSSPPSSAVATDPATGWKIFEDKVNGFSFKYPSDYSLSGMGVISPLNPNRNTKDTTVQNGELKIEVYVSKYAGTLTVESCFEETSESAKILDKSRVIINNKEYETILWEGLGTGEFTCIKHNDKRYIITKYPAVTTRQNEYSQILSTFQFIESTPTPSPQPSPLKN